MTRPSLQPSQQLLANLEGRRRRCRRRQAAAGKFVQIPACRKGLEGAAALRLHVHVRCFRGGRSRLSLLSNSFQPIRVVSDHATDSQRIGTMVASSSVPVEAVKDEFERKLEELFTQVKSMLLAGDKEGAVYLLEANYLSVKEEMDAGQKGMEQAAMLDVIALGYTGVGDLKLVESLMNMLSEIVGAQNDDPRLDSILMHMGSMYTSLRRFVDAISVYSRGLGILENSFGRNSPFLMTPLLGMAKVYSYMGKASKAIEMYQRAISILEIKRGIECEDLVVPLFGLGDVFIGEGKADDAEDIFNRILSIYTKLYGKNDGRVGLAMCSLAHALCAKGTVNNAIDAYKKGLQIIKNSQYIDLDDSLLEYMRIDLAELLHVAGREHEGRELLEECLLISDRNRGGSSSSVIHLINLASSYLRSKNYAEAERLLRTSLGIMSNSVGPEDQSITIPMLHLSVALYHLKKDEEAEAFALEVVRIREEAFGALSLPVGEALDCLVSIQTRLGKDKNELLVLLVRILEIQEKELGNDSEEVMVTLKKLVFILDELGRRDEKMPLKRRLSLLRTKYKQRIQP